jgi:hypothetical protein
MKRTLIVAAAAGMLLAIASPSAFADGWQPTSGGSVTFDAINPCTGQSADFTLVWTESLIKATKSGAFRSGLNGTYTATDGSSGTARTTWSTTYTKDGYADSYHEVLVGEYDGHSQRLSFVFRIVVGDEIDVKVMHRDSSCGSA